MELKRLRAIVGKITVKMGLFGGKPFATLSDNQLAKVEAALGENNTSELADEINTLKQNAEANEAKMQSIKSELKKAMTINNLKGSDNVVEDIKALGEQCKAYGEKTTVHTQLSNNGKEAKIEEDKLIDGYIDPNAEHNRLLGIG